MSTFPKLTVAAALIIGCVGLSSSVFAQEDTQTRIEQSRQKLRALPTTAETCEQRILLICSIGAELSRVSIDSSRAYFQDAMRLSEKCDNKSGKAQALMCLTNIEMLEARTSYTKILESYNEAATLFKEAGRVGGEVSCYTNIGNIYMNQNKWIDAETYYKKSIGLSQAIL